MTILIQSNDEIPLYPCPCMPVKKVASNKFGSCGYVSCLSFAWCSFR